MGKKRTRRKVNPRDVDDQDPDDDDNQDDDDGEQREAEVLVPRRLAPDKDEDGKQVYFRNQDTGDIQAVDRENYLRLQSFINQQPDRGRYSIAVYRKNNAPGMERKSYLKPIDLPQGLLDEEIRINFGGGEYYWQLMKDGAYASRADLPADMTDAIKMSGSVTIDGDPINKPMVPTTTAIVNGGNEVVVDLLRDQIKELQKNSGGSSSAMVQLMTVMMAGMQQQQQQSNNIAQQQTQFMMQMMTLHDKKSAEVSSGKEALYKEIIELMKTMGGGGGGEPDSFGTALLKAAPGILDKLGMLPGLANVSPRKTVQLPAPVPVVPRMPVRPNPSMTPAPAPSAPIPVVAVPVDDPNAFATEDEPYLMEVVSTVWDGFKSQATLDQTCEKVANLGTEIQFDKLLTQENDWVSRITATAWAAFQPGEAIPDGLLAYARAVHVELCREEPVLPEGRAAMPAEPAALPTAAPVVPNQAPAVPNPAPVVPPAPPVQSTPDAPNRPSADPSPRPLP
jgi:hypothetical protein